MEGGIFGDTGSGIALIQLAEKEVLEGEKKITRLFFEQVAADFLSDAVKSVAFDKSSVFIKIDNNLAAMTNIVDMYWDSSLQRLFIAFQGTSGAGASDGMRAVVVGRVTSSGKLIFDPIAPVTVFEDSNEIVGSRGASTQVSMHKVRTMHTSTGLDYLIVLGGNGTPSATQRSVFGLPVVNTRQVAMVTRDGKSVIEDFVLNEAIQGTLANKNELPISIFTGDNPSSFIRREITKPALVKADVYTSSDFQAQVGGGALVAGDILDIMVAKDTVFAIVGEPADGSQLPGVFYSQALFDEYGRIHTWTQWRRVAGTTDKVFGISYEPKLGNFDFMTGADASNVNIVRRTAWGEGAADGLGPVGQLIAGYFPPQLGGVQGLFDFSQITPGLTNMSILAATGLKQIMLVESGQKIGGGPFTPNTGDFFVGSTQEFKQGTISPAANAKVLILSGGVLNDLGPIVSIEIGTEDVNDNGWFFVGGDGGLAVLASPDGFGFNSATGLQPSFIGLADGMSFKKIGNYSFVRALLADENFLYVLTDTKLDRIDLVLSDFTPQGKIVSTTVANLSQPSVFMPRGTLLDFIVSEKFALLSTTNGLYRIGDGKDIRTVNSVQDASWIRVPIAEVAGSATQLIAFSSTGRIQDVARDNGGNIYALNGYTGISKGQVNRFFINDVTAGPITSTTLQAVPDIRIEGIPSYFKNFGGFANQYISDGALQLYSRCRDLTQPPFVKSVQPGRANNDITIPLKISSFSNVTRLLRDTASGSWIIAGDFIRINE